MNTAKSLCIPIAIQALAGLLLTSAAARAQTEFVLKDPKTDFEVLDFQPFDGVGDNGPYSTFNTIGLGLYGDDREMAEFDLAAVAIPDGEEFDWARLDVQITSIHVWSDVL